MPEPRRDQRRYFVELTYAGIDLIRGSRRHHGQRAERELQPVRTLLKSAARIVGRAQWRLPNSPLPRGPRTRRRSLRSRDGSGERLAMAELIASVFQHRRTPRIEPSWRKRSRRSRHPVTCLEAPAFDLATRVGAFRRPWPPRIWPDASATNYPPRGSPPHKATSCIQPSPARPGQAPDHAMSIGARAATESLRQTALHQGSPDRGTVCA